MGEASLAPTMQPTYRQRPGLSESSGWPLRYRRSWTPTTAPHQRRRRVYDRPAAGRGRRTRPPLVASVRDQVAVEDAIRVVPRAQPGQTCQALVGQEARGTGHQVLVGELD